TEWVRLTAPQPPPIRVIPYDAAWAGQFEAAAARLREAVGGEAIRIDHIGSTAVEGLAAKDVIDIQVTVDRLTTADRWPDELLPGLTRRRDIVEDHVPPGASGDPAEWQ